MLAQRIKTGFHRIGLAIAVPFGVMGVLFALAAVPIYFAIYFDWFQRPPDPDAWLVALGSGLGSIALGALAYVVARTIGWIIAGFVGDDRA